MKRRSRAGGKPVKTRPGKTVRSKRGNAPKIVRRSFDLNEKVALLTRELNEALERQTATSQILGAISRSKFQLQPILQSVVDTAARLCRAEQAQIFRREDGIYRHAVFHGAHDPVYLEIERQTPISPGPGTLVGRVAMTRQVARIDDAWTDPLYEKKEDAKIGGLHSMIGVPLMREGEPLGVIALARTRVEPFAEREIELVTIFANQAVIAIENVRLFEAEQQRTRELSEALEQQMATAEVLRVISGSPGDLQPVFASMLENAVRICDAQFGNIYRWDGDALHLAAAHNIPPAFAEFRGRTPLRPNPNLAMGRMVATKAAIHVADNAAEQAYIEREPSIVAAVELGGVRTYVGVPMLKGNELIGAVTVYRQEVRPFTDKQIELVQNFAAQAVIAIENTRLLNELRQRTTDLTERTADLSEALEQQTATSEVLGVINSSPDDLIPVFGTVLKKAVGLCDAAFGMLTRFDGECFQAVALHGVPPGFAEFWGQPRRSSLGLAHYRLTQGENVVQSTISQLRIYTFREIRSGERLVIWPGHVRYSGSPFGRTMRCWEASSSTERKCGLSPTSRSRC